MVFTAPAVHYSALATIPPRTSAPSSQPLIKWNQIIKRFLRSDDHPKPIIEDDRPLLKAKTSSPRHPHFNDETDFSIIKQNFAHADAQATVDHLETKLPNVSSSPIEPRERLPFSGPHLSPSSNNEQESTKLSAYHRHCTRQEKFIRQKQYPPLLSNANRFDPSDLPRFRDESTSNFASHRLQNSIDQQRPGSNEIDPDDANEKRRVSPIPFHDSCIGLRRNSLSSRLGNPWSCAGSQSSRLRRLQSKSKVRPVSSSDNKTLVSTKSATHAANKRSSVCPSSISSSIAHRIELLKQAMQHGHETHLDEKAAPLTPATDTINRETQTSENLSKYSEMHYILHHHLHSASILSLQWRSLLSMLVALGLIFLFVLEILTILL